MNIVKPTIIISCSDRKRKGKHPAFDLYEGVMFKDLRKHCSDALVHYNILIMSAKFGLIDARTVIQDYNAQLGVDVQPDEWIKTHKKSATKLLRQCAEQHAAGGLFVFLPKIYQFTFELLLKGKTQARAACTSFKKLYFCKGHRGNGDQRNRFIKALQLHNKSLSEPLMFRSGITSRGEFEGAVLAGQSRGFSMADIHPDKTGMDVEWILSRIKLDLFAEHAVFYDNGLIGAIKKGQNIDPSQVLSDMENFLPRLAPGSGKKLYFVLPDDPFNQANAVKLLRDNRDVISRLSKTISLIMPIHKPAKGSISTLARYMLKAIGDTPVVLGIPCRKDAKLPGGKTVNLRLDPQEIESLFNLKSKNGPCFERTHYLGLSEASGGGILKSRSGAYAERLALAHLYDVEMSCDICVMQSFFGANDSSRLGNKAVRKLEPKLMEYETENSSLATYLRKTCDSRLVAPLLTDLQFSFSPSLISNAQEFCGRKNIIEGQEGKRLSWSPNQFVGDVSAHRSIDPENVVELLIHLFKKDLVNQNELPSYDRLRSLALAEVFNDPSNPYTSRAPHTFTEVISSKPPSMISILTDELRSMGICVIHR